jgi:hypothetical protein
MDTTNLTSFEKIVVPRCWTGEQDIQACIDSFGEVDDYFGEALARVDAGYDELERSLDGILILTGNADRFTAHIIQRIDALRQHFLRQSPTEADRERFLGHLGYCRFAAVEYFRIIPGYLHEGDLNWLLPLVRLSDYLIAAASGLSAGMKGNHSATDVSSAQRTYG